MSAKLEALKRACSYGDRGPIAVTVMVGGRPWTVVTDGVVLVAVRVDMGCPSADDKVTAVAASLIRRRKRIVANVPVSALREWAGDPQLGPALCYRCNGTGCVPCLRCDGTGHYECECPECGDIHRADCDCDGGRVGCPECDGSGTGDPEPRWAVLDGLAIVNRVLVARALTIFRSLDGWHVKIGTIRTQGGKAVAIWDVDTMAFVMSAVCRGPAEDLPRLRLEDLACSPFS